MGNKYYRGKYCGAKLRRDAVGQYCPTKNCQCQIDTLEDCYGSNGLEDERLSIVSILERIEKAKP